MVRLQCYEGIAAAEALYEWNYPRQLLAIRLAEAEHQHLADSDLFSEEYLLARPLLTALDHPGPRPAVLLIDEVDRADDEFEAFLFELLAESAVTIPELGTRKATFPPIAILTFGSDCAEAVPPARTVDAPGTRRRMISATRPVSG